VAEFFVLRRHRRSGVGRRAAFALFDRLPGHWVVRVAESNQRGLPFWSATVPAYTGGRFERLRRADARQTWNVFSFDSPAAG
jgi:predicted acetyltransferase